jgi:hypothetical protein
MWKRRQPEFFDNCKQQKTEAEFSIKLEHRSKPWIVSKFSPWSGHRISFHGSAILSVIISFLEDFLAYRFLSGFTHPQEGNGFS